MFIEFIGLPGSGKTYLCSQIENDFSEKGVKTVNLIEMSRSKSLYKLYFKFIRFFAKMNPKIHSVSVELQTLLVKYRGIQAKYNDCKIDSYISDICELVFLKHLMKKSEKVLLLDEGLLQRAVTIAINYGLSKSDFTKLIRILEKHIDSTVYLKITCDDAFSSIRHRNRHVCIMDDLSDEKLKKFLRKYYDLCECVSEQIHLTILHRNDPENLKIINEKYRFGGK